ncbi:MAG TPA: redox-sensing transcriptional repressor Rex [Candidatus Sulfopaludibacter sp.]|jgi:redox-sensing transcriptional repressor|nr:redox-sensing transcriptional repressor Rex [Candidatus Sulfopaludibacter sp.]
MPADRPVSQSRNIPEASLRRLPKYYHLLTEMMAAGTVPVSCSVIGRALNLDPTQVRKDIEAVGVIGKPKTGYTVTSLIRGIEDFLGWNNTKEAFLAGAGSLGSALLGYEKFRRFGLDIVAAFDTDPYKVGQQIHGKEILHMDRLPELAESMHIHLGVIATPAAVAQLCADRMVEGGIRAIWNFAPVHLRVPDFVILQNEDLYPSLASLSFKLEKRMIAERTAALPPLVDPE